MKPPFCATSLPLGDGAHCEEIGRGHLEMCDFSNRKYVTILFRGYPAAGACLHTPMSLRVFKKDFP
jgi:hypothetical protein